METFEQLTNFSAGRQFCVPKSPPSQSGKPLYPIIARPLKRLLKIILTFVIAILLIIWSVTTYLKYSLRQFITEKTLSEIISPIKSARSLPDSFKETYSKVYPDIFKNDLNATLTNSIFRKKATPSPSRQIAEQLWMVFGGTELGLRRKLHYIGFIWILEDSVTQEKCFEYYVSHYDFGYNTRGIYNASLKFYNKPLDSLTIDEQLGIILLLKNPAYFNKVRNPDRHDKAVKELKDKITGYNSKQAQAGGTARASA